MLYQTSELVNREDRLVSLLEGVDIVSTALFTMYLSWAHQLYVSLYCLIAKLCEMRAVPCRFALFVLSTRGYVIQPCFDINLAEDFPLEVKNVGHDPTNWGNTFQLNSFFLL